MKKKNPSPLIKQSTRALFNHGKLTRDYSLYDFMHGYVYTRWPYLYISIGTGEHPLVRTTAPLVRGVNRVLQLLLRNRSEQSTQSARFSESESTLSFADGYHGKVVPLEPAKRLVTIGEDIDLPDLEQVIPYTRARDIILRNPDHIAVLDCPCRASRSDPCQPVDVCLVVGEPFASFVIDHHPQRARWISQSQAVEILEAENERGHVHHAFFKDAMLGRFYAICNCCSCCCGAMQAHRNGTPMLASSGYVSHVERSLCTGCTDCTAFCQFGALSLAGDIAQVNAAACMGCGVCVDKCSQEALSLQRDETKGIPLEINELMEQAMAVH